MMYVVCGKLLETLPFPNKLFMLAMIMEAVANSNPVSVGSAMVIGAAITNCMMGRMAPYRGKMCIIRGKHVFSYVD
jgi:hypothetical protein